MASREFEDQLLKALPKLRSYAIRLTRDAAAADDLLQDVAAKALAASESFALETNITAWTRRIMINQFISSIRTTYEICGLEDVPEISVSAVQQVNTDLREAMHLLHQLPRQYRAILCSVALHERSYEELSGIYGIAIGTLKSRAHRARIILREQMFGTTVNVSS